MEESILFNIFWSAKNAERGNKRVKRVPFYLAEEKYIKDPNLLSIRNAYHDFPKNYVSMRYEALLKPLDKPYPTVIINEDHDFTEDDARQALHYTKQEKGWASVLKLQVSKGFVDTDITLFEFAQKYLDDYDPPVIPDKWVSQEEYFKKNEMDLFKMSYDDFTAKIKEEKKKAVKAYNDARLLVNETYRDKTSTETSKKIYKFAPLKDDSSTMDELIYYLETVQQYVPKIDNIHPTIGALIKSDSQLTKLSNVFKNALQEYHLLVRERIQKQEKRREEQEEKINKKRSSLVSALTGYFEKYERTHHCKGAVVHSFTTNVSSVINTSIKNPVTTSFKVPQAYVIVTPSANVLLIKTKDHQYPSFGHQWKTYSDATLELSINYPSIKGSISNTKPLYNLFPLTGNEEFYLYNMRMLQYLIHGALSSIIKDSKEVISGDYTEIENRIIDQMPRVLYLGLDDGIRPLANLESHATTTSRSTILIQKYIKNELDTKPQDELDVYIQVKNWLIADIPMIDDVTDFKMFDKFYEGVMNELKKYGGVFIKPPFFVSKAKIDEADFYKKVATLIILENHKDDTLFKNVFLTANKKIRELDNKKSEEIRMKKEFEDGITTLQNLLKSFPVVEIEKDYEDKLIEAKALINKLVQYNIASDDLRELQNQYAIKETDFLCNKYIQTLDEATPLSMSKIRYGEENLSPRMFEKFKNAIKDRLENFNGARTDFMVTLKTVPPYFETKTEYDFFIRETVTKEDNLLLTEAYNNYKIKYEENAKAAIKSMPNSTIENARRIFDYYKGTLSSDKKNNSLENAWRTFLSIYKAPEGEMDFNNKNVEYNTTTTYLSALTDVALTESDIVFLDAQLKSLKVFRTSIVDEEQYKAIEKKISRLEHAFYVEELKKKGKTIKELKQILYKLNKLSPWINDDINYSEELDDVEAQPEYEIEEKEEEGIRVNEMSTYDRVMDFLSPLTNQSVILFNSVNQGLSNLGNTFPNPLPQIEEDKEKED